MELLVSDGWRDVLRDLAMPFAFEGLTMADLGDDVLEIGPGPGMTTDLLREQLPRMTAIELEPELAEALATRLAGTNVEVVEGDATATPFESDRFSAAVSFTMLHHVPTIELQDALFAEACRVLRPGGVLVANDSVASDDLLALHDDDVYNPVDPTTLEARLLAAGFVTADVRHNAFAWAVHARA